MVPRKSSNNDQHAKSNTDGRAGAKAELLECAIERPIQAAEKGREDQGADEVSLHGGHSVKASYHAELIWLIKCFKRPDVPPRVTRVSRSQ
jgi:hypothetical protein